MREAPARVGFILLNVMLIPVILGVAFLSALFGGSNAMNEAIAHFMMMMGLGAGVRLFVVISLIALRWSKPA